MNTNIRQVLRRLVLEWQARPLPEILPRDLEIGDWFSGPVNKIVTIVGFRRVGKTYLLLDYAKKHGKEDCLYLNLEDERLPRETAVLTELVSILGEFYGQRKMVLLLDEIQEIPDWSRWARRVNESGLHNLALSGSSSKLSSMEIPTELRGRTVTKTVFPLSFAEFKNWKGSGDDLNLLRNYLVYGGFPEVVLSDEGKKPILLDEYFQTFILRDIIERYHPRQETAMRDLIRLVLSSPYYTFGKLTKSLVNAGYRIGKTTVSNYLSWLISSYFLQPLEIHSARVKARIQHPKKAYFADSFFVSRLAGNFSENLGRLMEQAVAQNFFRQKAVNPNLEIYYWKNQRDLEVDFVQRENQTVTQLVQVSYASQKQDIAERELTALLRAGEEMNCQNLVLVTWDYQGTIETAGHPINCIPLNTFLTSGQMEKVF